MFSKCQPDQTCLWGGIRRFHTQFLREYHLRPGSGETARLVAERFGKTMQERETFTISSADTSINQSQHLEYSIPASRISALSSGELVGMVAGTPEQPIELKTFCCRIVYDPVALTEEQKGYQEPANCSRC
jgi:hypothetical protein